MPAVSSSASLPKPVSVPGPGPGPVSVSGHGSSKQPARSLKLKDVVEDWSGPTNEGMDPSGHVRLASGHTSSLLEARRGALAWSLEQVSDLAHTELSHLFMILKKVVWSRRSLVNKARDSVVAWLTELAFCSSIAVVGDVGMGLETPWSVVDLEVEVARAGDLEQLFHGAGRVGKASVGASFVRLGVALPRVAEGEVTLGFLFVLSR